MSAYGPGGERSEEDIEDFWSELRECIGSFGMNESVVVLGDLNARVGNEVIEGIVGQHMECHEEMKVGTIAGDVCRVGVRFV